MRVNQSAQALRPQGACHPKLRCSCPNCFQETPACWLCCDDCRCEPSMQSSSRSCFHTRHARLLHQTTRAGRLVTHDHVWLQPEPDLQPLLEPEPQPSSVPANSDYTSPGPFRVARLPRLEHTCHKLFPQCLGTQCLLRLDIFCPKGGSSFGEAALHRVCRQSKAGQGCTCSVPALSSLFSLQCHSANSLSAVTLHSLCCE